MKMRAASDVGGTFTDLVYYDFDPQSLVCGLVHTAKVDTTPPRFEEGVMNSLHKAGVNPAALDFFAHGSTVVINALTERKGVKTALITTRGFRDVLEIARGNRPDLFNFNFRKPKPFVDRYLRAELDERVNFKGQLNRPVDLAPLDEMLAFFRSEGVEAIAVCFLHAYQNPENEIRVVDHIRQVWPQISVLASHQISREWREYERTNTCVLAAYVHPIAKKYILSLEARLKAEGFAGEPYMMQSNGGIATAAAAKDNPITMVESGPASGIYAAAHIGKAVGESNLIVLDIGGTTAKCTLIENGEIKVTTEYHIERDRKNPGYPIQTPVSEIVEIGNGGGSIAWVDEGGKLHVGPQSAGAMPGPAAYGRGGTKPTTTDANLLLGRIDPLSFAGGELKPDMKALEAAFKPLAAALGVTSAEAARGVVRIANANMTNALRLVSTNKGYDPRDFALMAFGGGGAMHAVALAEELQIPRVIVPIHSAVFSALGMLLTDLRHDYIRTHPLTMNHDAVNSINSIFKDMTAEARRNFSDSQDQTNGEPYFEYCADMRYEGQEHTVKITLPLNEDGMIDLKMAASQFHAAHEKRYTFQLESGIQIVNFHLIAKLAVAKPEIAKKPRTGRLLEDTILHSRKVDFDTHGIHEAIIYNGLKLEPGMELFGPAVVQEPSVTLVVSPGHRLTMDDWGNYHVHLNNRKDA